MKLLVSMLAATAVMGAGVLLAGMDKPVSAESLDFTIDAKSENEVPPVDSPGSATGEFTFDDQTNELQYRVTVSGLSEDQVTAAHIHSGAEGENGPVLYTLSDVGFTETDGTVTLSDEDAQALMDGELYLNVHSVDHPDGFARAQLELTEDASNGDQDSDNGDQDAGEGDQDSDDGDQDSEDGDVSPPSTGDAGLAAGGSAGLTSALVMLLSGAALVTTAVLVFRRRVYNR